ncbi:peptidase M15 [Paracnuella aquatica]|nr:peptidase M15 [Paracnuella aquatica]
MLHYVLCTMRVNRRLICAACLAITTPLFVFSQEQTLKVINKPAQHKHLVRADSMQKMVALDKFVPGIIIELQYATAKNFTGVQLYPPAKTTFVRLPVARALAAVQQQLATMGLGLKVWDAYRPHSTTKEMWDLIKDERYVANPAKGSGHNRGIAVDVTLIDLRSGEELDMGTPFDHFTEAAHHNYKGLTAAQQEARTLLKNVMEQNGFRALATEWWHYSWPDGAKYEVLDLSFNQLARLAN